MRHYARTLKSSEAIISERRQKLWTCLAKGMKTYEITKELNTDHSTISRDINYLTSQSQNYSNSIVISSSSVPSNFIIAPYLHLRPCLILLKLILSCQFQHYNNQGRSPEPYPNFLVLLHISLRRKDDGL
jgi:hypothetical protein